MKWMPRMHSYRVGVRIQVLKSTAAMFVNNTRLVVCMRAYPICTGEDLIVHQLRFPEDGGPGHGREENQKG